MAAAASSRGAGSDGSPVLTTKEEVLEAVRRAAGEPNVVTVGLFGSVDFYNGDSEALCVAVGQGLARTLPSNVVILTGANAIVHEMISRAFHDTILAMAAESPSSSSRSTTSTTTRRVFHLAPVGYDCCWAFGTVLSAGHDMAARRVLLAGSSDVGISVEGGPGTADEMGLCIAAGAVLLPFSRTGGASAGMFGAPAVGRPGEVAEADWALVADASASVDASAAAMVNAVRAVIEAKQQ